MSINNQFLALTLSAMITASAITAAGASIGSAAPDFKIDDQYDHPVQLSAYRGKPLLIVAGDRQGSEYMNAWEHGAKAAVTGSRLTVIEIAILNGVPGFMHAYVKHRFQGKNSKGRANSPVVLDWDGLIPRSYGFRDDLTNVYLIDSQGVLIYTSAGKGTPEDIDSLIRAANNISQAGNRIASDN